MTVKKLFWAAMGGVLLFFQGCKGPEGPVAPETVKSPPSNVVIHPLLADYVGFPEGQSEILTWTQDGRLHYEFKIQNRSDKQLRLRIRAAFYDEAGALSEPEQGPRLEFLEPYQLKTIAVTASNKAAKNVKVQVAPAD